jgi:hypothetical protein
VNFAYKPNGKQIEPEPELVSITMSPMSSTLDVPQTQSLEVQVSPLEIGSAGEADINYPWAEVKSLTSTMDEGSAPSTPPTFEAGDAYNMGDLKAALDYAVESSHICDAWRSGSHIPSAQAQSSAPPAVPVVPDASDDRKVMRTAIRNGVSPTFVFCSMVSFAFSVNPMEVCHTTVHQNTRGPLSLLMTWA